MSQIFKINHIDGNEIKHIYIFTGSHSFKTGNYGPDGHGVFNHAEWENISRKSIPLTIIPHYIHGDDTISMVKKKLVKYLKLEKSIKQLYLFSIKRQILNPTLLFNQLSQDNQIDVTHQKLCQFMSNIIAEEGKASTETCDDLFHTVKDTYDFDDFLALNNFEWTEERNITNPLGQKLIIKRKYPFVANPFNITSQDPIIYKDVNNILTTQTSNLLFEYGELEGNNIFVCYADEVLQYAASQPDLTEKYMISLFFPFLSFVDHIHSRSQLKERAHYLYEDQKLSIQGKFEEYNANVNLFYDMFFTRKNDLEYLEHTPGISNIEFTIHPLYNINFPLEILFKLIHSTEEIPMIKYNPGNNRENIYRFYTDKIATNGKKIPYLFTINGNKKGLIMKLTKLIATKKKVGFYISLARENKTYELICEFEMNGNINVHFQLNQPTSIDTIQEIIREALNEPILDKISSYLEQSGYSYITFNTLRDDNIEIKKIEYISALVIKKNVHLRNLIKCLSSVFNVVEGDLTKKSERLFLQYKRVSNYNEMDNKEAFINELRRQGMPIAQIINELESNFKMTEHDAKMKVANWVSNVKTETGLFENKDISIRTNGGFPIIIKRNKQNFQTMITVDLINNVHYLPFIHIYIDSLLRLITQKGSSELSIGSINKLCKGRKTEDLLAAEKDIQAEVEKGLLERKTAVINDNKVVFVDEEEGQQEQQAALLDLLLGDDDDDDTDEDSLGIEFGDEIGEDFSLSPEAEETKEASQKKQAEVSLQQSPESISPLIPSLSPPSGDESSSDAEVDLTGMPLKGAQNIFLSKKLQLEPTLFLKRPQGRFTAYSKACPAQYAKQPVMLTAKEKAYIDTQDAKAGTKSYDEHITYGTGDTKYHYICPRFWCLGDEEGKSRSISFKEINEGKCGGWDALIPEGSSKVPEGGRIFEFTDTRFHKENVKNSNLLVYKPMYPGFIPPHKHPNNLCIPCCFGKPTTAEGFKKPIPFMYKPVGKHNNDGKIGPAYETTKDGNIKLDTIVGEPQIKEAAAKSRKTYYEQCNQTEGEEGAPKTTITKKKDSAPLLERFPLDTDQLGYLPIAVQKFMGYNCRKICQHSANDKQLKLKQPCLLHKGMIKSETQSFLACIADIYQYIHEERDFAKPIPLPSAPRMNIDDLKAIIVERLTLDIFITLQNGALVELFAGEQYDDVSIDSYTDTQLYKTLEGEMETSDFAAYFKRIVSAYEHFIQYLKDPSIVIDYEYLWDFITTPMSDKGGGLFPKGINLIILRSPEDDITDKLELVCPTNHYSANAYDVNKRILILYNKGNYYEPIYKYTRMSKDKYEIRKLFYLPDMHKIMPEIERIMSFIWHNLVTKCRPLPSMPEKYNSTHSFKENINASSIIHEISKGLLGYTVTSQIVNFETKVIGILVSKHDAKVYIPCRPSGIIENVPYTYVHDPNMWQSYTVTRDQLSHISAATKGKIPCQPKIKIVDNNIVIGILTETNQMVPVKPEPYQAPVQKGAEVHHLKVIQLHSSGDQNFLQIDENTLMSNAVDEERIKIVEQIKLESNFYNIFRNLLRIVLTNFEHKREKENLLEIINSPILLYQDKLHKVNTLLHSLLAERVEFSDFDISTLHNIRSITQCLGLEQKRCDREEICTFSTTGNTCILQLPKKNLINGSDNAVTYYGRLSDELIRYPRIQTYIFKPKTFLSFQEIHYQLRENEIILLEEILYGDYFVDLVAAPRNPFVSNRNVYDLVEPQNTVPYKSRYNLDVLMQSREVNKCVIEQGTKHKLFLGHWKDGRLIRERVIVEEDGKKKMVLRSHREPPILEGFDLLEFKHTFNCSWEIMVSILSDFKDTTVPVGEIRQVLLREYGKLFKEGRREQILDLLKKEGKRDQVTAIEGGTSIVDIITMSNYFLSLFDFFILAKNYKLPCMILCRTHIPTFYSEVASFIEPQHSDFTYYIFSGTYHLVDSNRSPIYGLISKDDSIRIPNAFVSTYNTLKANNVTTVDEFMAQVAAAEERKAAARKKMKIQNLRKQIVVNGT